MIDHHDAILCRYSMAKNGAGFLGVENGDECLQILQNKLADCREVK